MQYKKVKYGKITKEDKDVLMILEFKTMLHLFDNIVPWTVSILNKDGKWYYIVQNGKIYEFSDDDIKVVNATVENYINWINKERFYKFTDICNDTDEYERSRFLYEKWWYDINEFNLIDNYSDNE